MLNLNRRNHTIFLQLSSLHLVRSLMNCSRFSLDVETISSSCFCIKRKTPCWVFQDVLHFDYQSLVVYSLPRQSLNLTLKVLAADCPFNIIISHFVVYVNIFSTQDLTICHPPNFFYFRNLEGLGGFRSFQHFKGFSLLFINKGSVLLRSISRFR